MNTIKLQVGGFSYTGGKAGTGGDVFSAATSGAESEAVWYRKQGFGAAMAKLGVDLFGDAVGKAFLDRGQLSSLQSVGVVTSESEVRGAGMGNYVLWEMKPD